MDKKVKYSESDMAALIEQVENEFAQHLAKAEEKVEEVAEEATAEAAPEATEEVAAEAKADEEASVEKTEEKPASEEELDYDEEDFAEMDELYSSMSKSEAEAHLKSLQKALGEEGEAEVEEVVEEASEGEEKIAKSEEKSEDESETLQKSELEAKDKKIEELEEQNQKLEKSIKDLTSAVTKFVKRAPKQKAVTQIQYVAKSEDEVKPEEKSEDVSKLSVTEVSQRLSAKIRSGELKKAERDQITAYYEDGKKDIESIKHLL